VLRAVEQTKDFRIKAEALRQIANNRTQMGDWDAGLKAYEDSLDIVRELGDLSQVGLVYNCIGYGYFERGEHGEAMKYFQEALKLGKQCADLRLVADASNGLGMLASVRYDLDEAIRNYQISLSSYKETGESHYEAQAYQNLGIAHFKKDETKIADKYYHASLKISEKCGYIRLRAYTYLSRAELYLWESDLDVEHADSLFKKAIEFCEAAFQILDTLDDKWARAEGYKFYGMIYRRKRDFQSARSVFHTSLQISKESENLMNMAEVYCEMGLMYREEGMLGEAMTHFGKSREIFEELGITEEVQKIDGYMTEIKSDR
jgi:tetratricopeptide (TPR) repeat protein